MRVDKLSGLLHYYHARGIGHTTLMVEGIGAAEEQFFLLAHEHHYAVQILRDIGKHNVGIPISWSSFDSHRMYGIRAPLAIDNSAMMHILSECIELVERQEEIIGVRVAQETRRLAREHNDILSRFNKAEIDKKVLRDEARTLRDEGIFDFIKRKWLRLAQ